MNKEIKRLVKFVAISVLLILLIDWGLAGVLAVLYSNMNGGERGRANEIISRSNGGIYIFGSSRALGHYDPKIFEDSLGEVTYNAGRPAQTILYHLTVLKMILKRHKPKKIILDLNEDELEFNNKKYDLMASLLPYYKDKDVRAALTNVNSKYRLYSLFNVLPYNSSLIAIIYRSIHGNSDSNYHGYLPYKGFVSHEIKQYDNCNQVIKKDPILKTALLDFKNICYKNSIQLLVIISPRYAKYKCKRVELELLLKELSLMGIQYVDFSSNKKYVSNLDWMYDAPHLNRQGSIEFSKNVVKYLKRGTE